MGFVLGMLCAYPVMMRIVKAAIVRGLEARDSLIAEEIAKVAKEAPTMRDWLLRYKDTLRYTQDITRMQ